MNLINDRIYYKYCSNNYIFLILYFDDILLANNDIDLLYDFKRFLAKKYDMKDLGDISFIVDIQIHQNYSRVILRLSQKSYIEMILKRYGMQDCKLSDTLVVKEDKFSPNHCSKNDFEEKEIEKIMYKSAVRSLMYVQVCTGSNIVYAVGHIFKQSGVDYWKATKRVLLYL